MQNETIAFATTKPKSQIAVVDAERHETVAHFSVVRRQLMAFIQKVSALERKITLMNGTVIFFVPATSSERLRGLRLDRIETTPSALPFLPDEHFLETRLKPSVAPAEGMIYRAKGDYGTIITAV